MNRLMEVRLAGWMNGRLAEVWMGWQEKWMIGWNNGLIDC